MIKSRTAFVLLSKTPPLLSSYICQIGVVSQRVSHGGNSSELFSPAVSFFLPTLRPFSVLFATTPVEILIPILLTTKGRVLKGVKGGGTFGVSHQI